MMIIMTIFLMNNMIIAKMVHWMIMCRSIVLSIIAIVDDDNNNNNNIIIISSVIMCLRTWSFSREFLLPWIGRMKRCWWPREQGPEPSSTSSLNVRIFRRNWTAGTMEWTAHLLPWRRYKEPLTSRNVQFCIIRWLLDISTPGSSCLRRVCSVYSLIH